MNRGVLLISVVMVWLGGARSYADLLREVEPNDPPSAAQPCVPTVSIGGTIGFPSDRDVYAFRLPAAGIVQASVLARGFRAGTSPGSSLTALLKILSDDGTTVLVQDQSAGGFDDPAVATQVLDAGVYFVSVEDLNGLGGPDFRYVLSIEKEGNDGFATALPIDPPVIPSIDSLIWPAADLDFYSFQGTAGQVATIDFDSAVFDPLVPPVKGVVTLFGPDHLALATDAYTTSDPNDPFVQTVLPVSGTYYIEVHDLRGFIGSPASFYQLNVRLGPAPQNGSPATAVPLFLPRGLSGTVCPAGGSDDFSIATGAAVTLVEDVDARQDLQSLLHATVSLLSSNGTTIASNSDAPDPYVAASAPAGALTVVVQGPSDGLCEDAYYRLWVDGDADGDGIRLPADVCPAVFDPAQQDLDHDGVGDACDDCVAVFNPAQETNLRIQEPIADTLTVSHALGTGADLHWLPAPGSVASNVYRFSQSGPATRPVFTCLGDNAPGGSFVDPETPPPGVAFLYVVTGENCGESGGGADSSGQEEVLTFCPKSI